MQMSTSPQVLENEDEETLYSTPIFRSTARRTPSFSSSDSSSFSYSSDQLLDQSPPFSPSTPLKYKGIPFSWEKIPGIAKQQSSFKDNKFSGSLIPPPPARNSNSSAKKVIHREKKDPFYAALLHCSKDDGVGDDHDHHDMISSSYGNIFKGSSKITRTLSDRFGLISMYGSCKSTCAVSESVVYVPRSRTHDPHYLLNRRSS